MTRNMVSHEKKSMALCLIIMVFDRFVQCELTCDPVMKNGWRSHESWKLMHDFSRKLIASAVWARHWISRVWKVVHVLANGFHCCDRRPWKPMGRPQGSFFSWVPLQSHYAEALIVCLFVCLPACKQAVIQTFLHYLVAAQSSPVSITISSWRFHPIINLWSVSFSSIGKVQCSAYLIF